MVYLIDFGKDGIGSVEGNKRFFLWFGVCKFIVNFKFFCL